MINDGTESVIGAKRFKILDRKRYWSRDNLPAIACLAVCVALAVFAWYALSQDAERHRQSRFKLFVAELVSSIEARLRQHEQILLGGAGLLDADGDVDRSAWHRYVSRLNLA
jgi:sensor domain CHASE-containing protein